MAPAYGPAYYDPYAYGGYYGYPAYYGGYYGGYYGRPLLARSLRPRLGLSRRLAWPWPLALSAEPFQQKSPGSHAGAFSFWEQPSQVRLPRAQRWRGP